MSSKRRSIQDPRALGACHFVPGRRRLWVAMTCVTALGCAETLTTTGDGSVNTDAVSADVVRQDAAVEDVAREDVAREDVAREDVAREDVAREDVAREDVPPTCAAPSPVESPVPSPTCRVEAMRVDPMSLCGSGMACPVTSMRALRCESASGYGPWVTADGDGAAVLFVTNTGGFVPRLFSLPAAGADQAFDVRGVGVAAAALRGAPDGSLHLVYGETPGAAELARGASGWSRSAVAPPPPSGGLFVTDARFSAAAGYVTWFNFNNHAAAVATGRAGCWSVREIPDTVMTDLTLDLDRTGDAWVGYYASAAGGYALRAFAPDGQTHELWRASGGGEGLSSRELPRFVAGGLDGQGRWPVAVVRDPAGLSLRVRADDAPSWSGVSVPDTALGQPMGDCPTGSVGPGGDPCGGRSSCTQRTVGGASMHGLVRTASGGLWLVWTQRDDTEDFTLSSGPCTGGGGGGGGPGVDAGGPPRCVCMITPSGSRGELTVHIGRVTSSGVSSAHRFRFDTGGPVPGYFDVAARGEHLLMVVPVRGQGGVDLRYLDVDLTATP
ncbi:MAG: hypothetical protein R3A48_11660 [Polyangiales bacterium]